MSILLIVEDEAVLARNLARAFTARGLEVHHSATAAEARQAAVAAPPDVVLLDLRLPDGSGLDVLDALVAQDPSLPVIMMTAYGSVADAVNAMQRGARDYVQKPLDLAEIRLKVDRALQSARQGREISRGRAREGGRQPEQRGPPARHLPRHVALSDGEAQPRVLSPAGGKARDAGLYRILVAPRR